MKQQLKKWIPYSWKLQIKLVQQYFNEQRNNYAYPREYRSENIGKYSIKLRQTIKTEVFIIIKFTI